MYTWTLCIYMVYHAWTTRDRNAVCTSVKGNSIACRFNNRQQLPVCRGNGTMLAYTSHADRERERERERRWLGELFIIGRTRDVTHCQSNDWLDLWHFTTSPHLPLRSLSLQPIPAFGGAPHDTEGPMDVCVSVALWHTALVLCCGNCFSPQSVTLSKRVAMGDRGHCVSLCTLYI